MHRVAIVGASLAGVQAAQALRRGGYDGSLTLIGAETHPPYDRPPLSKDFLAGTTGRERLGLRAVADPDALGIDWQLGVRATALELGPGDEGPRAVVVDDDRRLEVDGVVVATGARPRTLPGTGGVDGVHVLRTLDDAMAVRAAFDRRPASVVVIGCGFIGAEVAATARQDGLAVTVIEAAEAPLERVLDREAGLAVAELHSSHGVDVRLSSPVDRLTVEDARVTGVELATGGRVPADVVVVGIGVVPETGWLASSGLTLDNGVVADETCLAAPGVVAAGDVACWPNPRFGGRLLRIEQWDNAVEMGTYAGRRLLAWAEGREVEPFAPVPWFWSDQYDRKIQLAGVAAGEPELVQGSLEERRFVRLYVDDGVVVGALCWNRPRQAIQARQMIADGVPADDIRERLA
ncbi:MAG: NAD(P)/FAD-dependent oxidoreductase [Acidimicrobiales bacterium]